MGMLSGLEKIVVWTLKKSKIKKQDSGLIKVAEFSLELISYPIVGALPGKIQESEAEQVGINPLKFTAFSIGYGVLSGGAKYFFGQIVEDSSFLEYLGMGLQWWALVGNTTSTLVRMGYVTVKKKPVGSLLVEGLYYLLPNKLTKKYEQRESRIVS